MAMLRPIFGGLAAFAALSFIALSVFLALLFYERSSGVELPTPTGPFAVGREIYDGATRQPSTPSHRTLGPTGEVLAWIWSPAVVGSSSTRDDYIPATMRAAAGSLPIPMRFVYRDASKVDAHSIRNADVAPQRPYPVVILSGAVNPVIDYTTLAEDLASHGYVVVGVEAPYRTGRVVFPDGRAISRLDQNDLDFYEGPELRRAAERLLMAWTSDTAFALDRLAQLTRSDPCGRFIGQFDMTRVGIFGHSFAGAQAVQFLP